MKIHITKKCIENHGVDNRIEWVINILREYMKKQIKESSEATFEIEAHFICNPYGDNENDNRI